MRRLRPPAARFSEYLREPEAYAQEVLGQTWWDKQAEVARAMVDHRRVLVMSCNGAGKTHLLGGLVQWWVDAGPGICYNTAPTWGQVKRLLWKELRRQRPRSGMPGKLSPEAPLLKYGPDWFAEGLNAASPEGFQGQHHRRLMFLLDEAPGCKEWIWDVGGRMCVAPENVILAVGNPFDSNGPFIDAADSGEWHVITISAMEHPNIRHAMEVIQPLIDAGMDVLSKELREHTKTILDPIEGAVSLTSVLEAMKDHCIPGGADDATCFEFPEGSGRWWRPDGEFEARVLGRRPTDADDSIVPRGWIEASYAEGMKRKPEGVCIVGIDSSQGQRDKTAFCVTKGGCVGEAGEISTGDPFKIALEGKRLLQKFGASHVNNDHTGGGWAVTKALEMVGVPVVAVNFSGEPMDKELYPNVAHELYGNARQGFRNRDFDLTRLSEKQRKELARQGASRKYLDRHDLKGRAVMEDKRELKKRLKCSPDMWEAFLLSVYQTDPPVGDDDGDLGVPSYYGE